MEKQWRQKRDAIEKPGSYPVKIILVEADVSKAGKPMLVVVFKTADGKHARTFFSSNEWGLKALASLKKACGNENMTKDELLNKELSIVCEWGKPTEDGKCFIEAKKYLVFGTEVLPEQIEQAENFAW